MALLVAGVTAALVATATGGAATVIGSCSIPGGARPVSPAQEFQVVSIVNSYRASLGLTQLTISPALTAAAEWKASHMATYGYMSHPDPAEGAPFSNPARNWDDRVLTCGYPVGTLAAAGENIAFGQPSPAAVVGSTSDPFETSWLSSPAHRAAIENPNWRVTGAGAALGGYGVWYWAQDFGTLNTGAPGSSFAVTMRSLTARATKHGVVVRWRTASEIDTAGFRVFRVINGTRIRINHRLIPAAGKSGGGHAYTFRDRKARAEKRNLTYWVQSIDLDATTSWYGPVRAIRS